MIFDDVCIEDISYILPESRVTSSQIEEHLAPVYRALKLPAKTLESLTGVRERRLWPTHLNPSYFASKVAEKLFFISNRKAQDIDLLIYTGVCRDFIEPATAHIVHHHLKLSPHCLCFDLSNACLGFLNGMLLSARMIQAGQVRNALIVSAENAAPLLENTINSLNTKPSEDLFRNSLASLTLGSGAVAMLLTSKRESSHKHLLQGGVSQVASEHHDLCQGRGDYRNPLMTTDSTRLLKEGVELSRKTWNLFLKELNCKVETFKHVLTHQVSLAHHERIFSDFGISSQRGRKDCEFLGNTGTVAAPLSLALSKEEGLLKPSDPIALLGIGSGLNTMMLGMQW